MFGWEVAVKHTLLASESLKYLGTEDSMINIELMSKLYLVVAHNLNKTRTRKPVGFMQSCCFVFVGILSTYK